MDNRAANLKLCATLGLTALICVWLGQNSIKSYWQEHYYRQCPLEQFDDNPLWRAGASLQQAVAQLWADNSFTGLYDFCEDQYDTIREQRGDIPAGSVERRIRERRAEQAGPASPVALSGRSEAQEAGASLAAAASPTQVATLSPQAGHSSSPNLGRVLVAGAPLILRSGDAVFFGGDSMMEGLVPHLSHWLHTKGIASVNKSRRSTGLAYPNPKVRDWPLEVENALKNDPKIKLVIMFLGPNDPWDMPNPAAPKGKFLRFRSEEWAKVYSERIGRILAAAESHRAGVIWLGLPYMRKPKFNQQMMYLDEVIGNATRSRACFLPTKNLLSSTGEYSDTMQVDGKNVTVRAKDGVHFSPQGQRILSKAVQDKIHIVPESKK